jgi:hypothetical protein
MARKKRLVSDAEKIRDLERALRDQQGRFSRLAEDRDEKMVVADNLRAELSKRDREIEKSHLDGLFCAIRAIPQDVGNDVNLAAIVPTSNLGASTLVLNVGLLRRAAVVAKKYYNI